MLKSKKYDWKDSNMALFGSDTEKNVKKESAESEPAWIGAGQEVGLQIWRIVKFKVEPWPKEEYGSFYDGDSYIVLNTFKKGDDPELKYDVHFWIGKYSTQDEYGTAAYKTVELDTFLNDKPVQHREVQGHESNAFKAYFPTLSLLKGGAELGFKHVTPETFSPRLLLIKKQDNKTITCTELSLKKGNLTQDDVFIIDNGLVLYQLNGSQCSRDEKYKAAQEIQKIKSSRGGKPKCHILELSSVSENHPSMKLLTDGAMSPKEDTKGERKMFRVSDADGTLAMTEIAISKDQLRPDDVYIINTGHHCYCWIGSGASHDERKNGLSYASNYINKTSTPWLPISVLLEGKETDEFKHAF